MLLEHNGESLLNNLASKFILMRASPLYSVYISRGFTLNDNSLHICGFTHHTPQRIMVSYKCNFVLLMSFHTFFAERIAPRVNNLLKSKSVFITDGVDNGGCGGILPCSIQTFLESLCG